MKTGFKDRTEVTDKKTIKNPWNFDQPPYDERTSCFVSTGTHYGECTRQPVGSVGNPKKEGVPMGRVTTLRTQYNHGNRSTNVDVREE